MSEQLRTNFINNIGSLVLPVALLLLSSILLSTCLSLYFSYDAFVTNSSYAEREEILAKLKEKNARFKQEELTLPAREKLQELNDAVVKINDVGTVKGRDITVLLSKLERLLPKSAYIKKLDHDRNKGVLLLVAEARTVDHLTEFLKNLESSKFFASVLLTRQNKDRSSGMFQYELRLIEASI